MADLVRLSISIERDLYEHMESMVRARGYTNRSEYFRDLVREQMVAEEWEKDRDTVGTVTLIYDHHARNLMGRLTELQHDHHGLILASTHVHLDHHMCAEVIIMKGRAHRLKAMAASLGKQRGVLHAALSMSTQGTDF